MRGGQEHRLQCISVVSGGLLSQAAADFLHIRGTSVIQVDESLFCHKPKVYFACFC